MNKILVSILSPVYNVENYLSQCLDSIICQSYSNLQIVLIDDGSKDNSWQIMQEYAAKDSRIEIYHQENQGVATTRNHLVEKVKGDYVLFVDSDDWIELDMVEYLLGISEKYNSGITMCDRVINDIIPSDKEPLISILVQEKAIEDFLKHDYFVGSLWNKLLERNLLYNLKFNNEISFGEDALFCWDVLQKLQTVVISSKQLYHYRMNDGSISHSSFGNKKMSGYYVWEKITNDVSENWPEMIGLAKAHRAVSALFLLRDAAHCDYPFDHNIMLLQKTLRENIWFMIMEHSLKVGWILYSLLISFFYNIGKLL